MKENNMAPKKDHMDPNDVAVDNLLVEVHVGFDGSIRDEIAEKYDIPVNDMTNDLNLELILIV